MLPLGELYLNKFSDFVQENILNYNLLNNLEITEQYKSKKELFDFICNSLTMFNDEYNTYGELKDLCSRMWRIDYLIEYLKNEKKYDSAIEQIDKFVLEMLEFSNVMFNNKKR